MAESEEQGKPKRRADYFSKRSGFKPSGRGRTRDTIRAKAEAQAAVRAAFDNETQAAKAMAAVQAEALNPPGGWWRPTRFLAVVRPGTTLREDMVAIAYSVGCTRAQIIAASGCTRAEIEGAKVRMRKSPPVWPITSEPET